MPLRTPSLRGALTMGYRAAHPWLPAERALLNAAAELVAQAAERARRFEAQHGTAQLLQRSMLPEHLPELDTFRIAARYDVGVDGNAAGGDFYDAFELTDGRLAMVLGDVAGHDVRAAAVMGQVRAALRALALTDPAPPSVLAGLDRLVGSLGAESRNEEIFVTVVYGVLDPVGGTITLASAGHPPPVLRRAGRAAGRPPPSWSRCRRAPRWAWAARWRTGRARSRRATRILMFSDGVVERRGRASAPAWTRWSGRRRRRGQRRPPQPVRAGHRGRGRHDRRRRGRAGGRARDHAQPVGDHADPGRADRPEPGTPVDDRPAARLVGARAGDRRGRPVHQRADHERAAARGHRRPRCSIDLSAERLLVSVADTGTRGAVTRAQTDDAEQPRPRPGPDRGAERRLGHRPGRTRARRSGSRSR